MGRSENMGRWFGGDLANNLPSRQAQRLLEQELFPILQCLENNLQQTSINKPLLRDPYAILFYRKQLWLCGTNSKS